MRLVHPLNKSTPRDVNELGKVIFVKFEHCINAFLPKLFNKFPETMIEPNPQKANADGSIDVNELGRVMLLELALALNLPKLPNAFVEILVKLFEKVIDVAWLQPANADAPILVIESGIVTESADTFKNAESPILTTG